MLPRQKSWLYFSVAFVFLYIISSKALGFYQNAPVLIGLNTQKADRNGSYIRNNRRRNTDLNHFETQGGLYPGYGTHFAYVYVGTPPQRVSVIVDTGSHYTAFPCIGCAGCGSHTDDYYDWTRSSTSHTLSCGECQDAGCSAGRCVFSQSYSEGSSWSAFQIKDTFFVGVENSANNPPENSQHAINFMFGCQTSETGLFRTQLADGIMGMDMSRFSLVDAMHAANVIQHNNFALCFRNGGGVMSMGGVDKRLHTSQMQFVPIRPGGGWYTVRLLEIWLGTIKLEISDSRYNVGKGTIVDSGTTDTYLTREVGNQFRSAWQQLTGRGYGNNQMAISEDEMNRLPSITYVFEGGVRVISKPSSYIEMEAPNKYTPRIYLDEFQGCVLGANFMNDHDVFFDEQGQRVGFAESQCNMDLIGVPTGQDCAVSDMQLLRPCNATCLPGQTTDAIGVEQWGSPTNNNCAEVRPCTQMCTVIPTHFPTPSPTVTPTTHPTAQPTDRATALPTAKKATATLARTVMPTLAPSARLTVPVVTRDCQFEEQLLAKCNATCVQNFSGWATGQELWEMMVISGPTGDGKPCPSPDAMTERKQCVLQCGSLDCEHPPIGEWASCQPTCQQQRLQVISLPPGGCTQELLARTCHVAPCVLSDKADQILADFEFTITVPPLPVQAPTNASETAGEVPTVKSLSDFSWDSTTQQSVITAISAATECNPGDIQLLLDKVERTVMDDSIALRLPVVFYLVPIETVRSAQGNIGVMQSSNVTTVQVEAALWSGWFQTAVTESLQAQTGFAISIAIQNIEAKLKKSENPVDNLHLEYNGKKARIKTQTVIMIVVGVVISSLVLLGLVAYAHFGRVQLPEALLEMPGIKQKIKHQRLPQTDDMDDSNANRMDHSTRTNDEMLVADGV